MEVLSWFLIYINLTWKLLLKDIRPLITILDNLKELLPDLAGLLLLELEGQVLPPLHHQFLPVRHLLLRIVVEVVVHHDLVLVHAFTRQHAPILHFQSLCSVV